MKIQIKRTPEQIELVKAMASRDRNVAYEAQLAMANFIGGVLAEVVNTAPTLSNMFDTLTYDADDNPSIPLDLYYDISDSDYITVWHQSVAGGLPRNEVLPTVSEMKVTTYDLESAVSFKRRYAAKSRMDVVGKTFSRLAQEILIKQEKTSANLLLGALADASTNSTKHVQRTATAGRFVLHDLNELLTLAKRINTSWYQGTPEGGRSRGITDLLVSPEIVQKIREMAYNPINTAEAPYGSALKDSIAGTDEFRNSLFAQAGIPNFYGVNIIEFNEFGKGQRWNTVFDTVAGATAYVNAAGSGSAAFNGANEEILVGIDRTRDSLMRVVAVDEDRDSEFNLDVDDQFVGRQKEIGYYGGLTEGRVVLDNRVLLGKIV